MRVIVKLILSVLLVVVTACNASVSTPTVEADSLVMRVVAPSLVGEVSWCEGDEILFIENGVRGYEVSCSVVDENGQAIFNVDPEQDVEAEAWSYDAIYPHSAYIASEKLNINQVYIEIPEVQHPTALCYDSNADLRIARHEMCEERPEELVVSFQRIAAHGAIILKNVEEGMLVDEITLTMSGRSLAGKCCVDLVKGVVDYSSVSASRSITLKPSEPLLATNPIYFVAMPLELRGGDNYTVEVVSGDKSFKQSVVIDEDDRLMLAAGGYTELPVTLPDPEPEKATYTFRRVDKVTSGKAYLIGAERCVALPVLSSYGYLDTAEGDLDDDGEIKVQSCENAFVFEATANGYTICQAVDSRYLYQKGNYNSFNVSTNQEEGALWSVKHEGEGRFRIENLSVAKFVQYHKDYDSFGSYASLQSGGVLPVLYELDGELVIEKPEPPVTPDVEGFLELPAERTDGAYPNALTVPIKVGAERNYTHFYDVDTYTSLWVAYPLESRHMGSYSRPGSWDWNPYISTSDQVNLCSRSYAGDYSRGHLIPNASRNGIREMQLQTFYVTNSVPQIQAGFNGGIWQNLEAALQDMAESKTLYIVTGVAFNKSGESKTISYTKAKDDSKQVPVPNYFYKVVLKVKTDSSGAIVDASTVGFWFEHRAYSDSYTNYAVSVDQIEKWTGFDYFPELPDALEAEAEQNGSWSTFKNF